tara:strand:- start:28 stop:570 length:543 start_codon:yes stop_codon:yes gene_type:complete
MGEGAEWLGVVAKQHDEWIRIVRSFGEKNYAEDIVQQSYLILHKYAEPDKVIENGKIRRGYMYFTLRTTYYLYYNQKRKVKKVSIDDGILQLIQSDNVEENDAYNQICQKIDKEIENWHWYDKKLFVLYRDSGLSIRKLAAETKISWVSIFNTLKNAKNIIKDKFYEDYEDFKNQDYDRL